MGLKEVGWENLKQIQEENYKKSALYKLETMLNASRSPTSTEMTGSVQKSRMKNLALTSNASAFDNVPHDESFSRNKVLNVNSPDHSLGGSKMLNVNSPIEVEFVSDSHEKRNEISEKFAKSPMEASIFKNYTNLKISRKKRRDQIHTLTSSRINLAIATKNQTHRPKDEDEILLSPKMFDIQTHRQLRAENLNQVRYFGKLRKSQEPNTKLHSSLITNSNSQMRMADNSTANTKSLM